MMRTKKFFWLMISMCAVIVCWAGARSFGDSANFVVKNGINEYSGKGSASIGSWYDETWQAGNFFLLKQEANPDHFRYESVPDPVASTKGKPTVFQSPAGAPAIPQDVVVTQWKVTGHVHFASSGM